MIINHWQPWFKQQFGGVLPDDYFCADVETSGFSREKDLILEWGHCLVEGRKCVDKMGILINWYASDAIPASWLDNQLARIARQMQLSGRPWHITPARLKAEGVEPKKAVTWIYELLCQIRDSKTMVVMHGGLNFDVPMLQSHFAQDLGKEFSFGLNQVFDTGSIEKASQLVGNPRVLPQPGESLNAYFRRINGWRAAGVQHNLDTHCVKKYKLDERFGVDSSTLHCASEDAYVTHLLFEEFRRLAEHDMAMAKAAVVAAPHSDDFQDTQPTPTTRLPARSRVAPARQAVPQHQTQPVRHRQRNR